MCCTIYTHSLYLLDCDLRLMTENKNNEAQFITRAFNGAETNCRMAHNLGILLMNSNCSAIFFSSILVTFVQISIPQEARVIKIIILNISDV